MKMDNDELLDILRRKEESASHYTNGQLRTERETALRAYHRLPYGNEEEGWSSVITSDVQDTVEWILPALLKIFTSTDRAVTFDPSRPQDVEGAEQATDTVNHVFYKQNNGFLTLYTAIKDALLLGNCAIHWHKKTEEVIEYTPFKNATPEMLAMLLQDGGEVIETEADDEVDLENDKTEKQEGVEESEPSDNDANELETPYGDFTPFINPQTGQPLINPMTGRPVMVMSGKIKKTEDKTTVKVEAFSPDLLLIDAQWTSPLLANCPYVCRLQKVTLSELHQLGFTKVTAEELRASDITNRADSNGLPKSWDKSGINNDENTTDDSMAVGYLRVEYAKVDTDGDGIAELNCIYRLADKVLSSEIVSHIPFATFSPVLNNHQWAGLSVHDLVGDLQKLHTEMLRQTLNSLYLANNPRSTLLTDANGTPYANIDDFLNMRPGAAVRQSRPDAIQPLVQPFAASGAMPMLDYIQQMREERTGVSRTSQGLNPDSLNNTATGRAIDQTATQQRLELIARICGEVLLKPTFLGILKLLTDGGMEKLAFRLRDQFIEYDPNEWRDQYDMTINVGLGTGDANQKIQALQMIAQNQMALMPMGLVSPEHIYHTQSKMVEAAGFKDVQNFISDPKGKPPVPPPPNPLLQVEQIKQQGIAQKAQFDAQQEKEKLMLEDQKHAREVERDMQMETHKQEMQARDEQFKAQLDAQRQAHQLQIDELSKQKDRELEYAIAEMNNQTKLAIAGIKSPETLGAEAAIEMEKEDKVLSAISMLAQAIHTPKVVVRDNMGKAIGIQPMGANNGT